MAYAIAQFDATDDAGNLLSGVTVEVRRETGGLQTAFSDREGTMPLGSTFVCESGKVVFYAPGNAYRIRLTKGSFQRELRYFAIGLAAESDMVIRNFRGEWGAAEAYSAFEMVTHDGVGFFVSTLDENVGNEPDAGSLESTPEWTYWAQEAPSGWKSIALLTVTGGTSNAIEATVEVGIDPSSVVAYVIEPSATNTGAVTINGVDVLAFDGTALEAGYLQGGTPVLLRVVDSQYRLLLDHRFQVLAANALQSAQDAAAEKELAAGFAGDADAAAIRAEEAAGSVENPVSTDPQTLSTERKKQARHNIDAASLAQFQSINAPVNLSLAVSVASNALTIAVKGHDGNNPSDENPVYVPFRSATANSGDVDVLKITAATSLVVSSGSTLGTTNAKFATLAVVGFNDGGTFRLGVVNIEDQPVGDFVASAVAEGGSGAADSSLVFYASQAITSKAYSVIGYISIKQTTAGTWANAPAAVRVCDAAGLANYVASAKFEVEYLVIAGGGAGGPGVSGVDFTGGGGAGGYRSSVKGEQSGGGAAAEQTVLVQAYGDSLAVVVGAGGTKGVQGTSAPASGANSSFGPITSIGGGAGSGLDTSWRAAASGGSGGGGSEGVNSGAVGTAGQGFAGGSAPGVNNYGSGGGGAGGVGSNGTGSVGGAGGNGVSSSITGTAVSRAGGGGGTGASTDGSASSGGGAGNRSGAGVDGAANTGGGGGAGMGSSGAGGSGVVIVRYRGLQRANGGVVTTANAYTIHTFTGLGAFTT